MTKVINSILTGARAITGALENGSLQRYLAVLFSAALVAGAYPFLDSEFQFANARHTPVNGAAIAAWLLLVIAAIALVFGHRNRLIALVLISVCPR